MTEASASSLTMQDGTRLHVVDYRPAGSASSSVVMLHGLGEHAGRYRHLAAFFTARGYAVRTYDHRGHGRSDGKRGDVPGDQTLLDDAHAVMVDWLAQPGTPSSAPLLLGHSMGGLFAARFATASRVPLSGLVLSSPALALPLNGARKLLLATLTAFAPGLAVSNGLGLRYLSHDAAAIDAYKADPLVHGKISARLLNAMLAAIAGAQQQAGSLSIPVLLLVSGQDRLVDAQGSRDFHARLKASQSRFVEYPTLYHELFNETNAAQVFGDLDAWLATLQDRVAA
jgi:alpha-beta hydrolase superfamily lysophospholipase